MLAHTDREHAFWAGAGDRTRDQAALRYASEGGGRCFRPFIDGFTRLDVREDTPDRLVVDTRYFWRDRFQEGDGGQVCAGFNERTFTLARAPDRDPVVVEMTGEQDEPAIRSLIRRLFSG